MSRKVFTAGEVLAAADVNSFLMDQTVMSFAGTAARGSAIGTAVEGMVTFLEDSNILSIYDGSNWKTSLGVTGGILQVVSTAKTDSFSTTSASFTAVTGLSASITPRSTSSRVIVFLTLQGGVNSTQAYFRLTRGGSAIAIGDDAGSRVRASVQIGGETQFNAQASAGLVFVDSPSSTSSLSYAVETRNQGSGTVFVNRGSTDTDSGDAARTISTITLMEVAG
jgi:hypothetical protein